MALAGATGAAALLAAAGCGASSVTDRRDGRAIGAGPTVVASTPVVADLARNVAGGDAEVAQMLEANSDPHAFEPRPGDVAALAGADVVLESGLGLDDWMDDVIEQAGGAPVVVDLGDAVRRPLAAGDEHGHAEADVAGDAHEEEGGHEDEAGHAHADGVEHADAGHDAGAGHDHGDVDPHWWHDPRNAIDAVEAIAAALAGADPARAAVYEANARRYAERLRALDRDIARCLSAIPEQRRQIVTDHDALRYLARRYDVAVVGVVIPSLTTQAQPSAGDLAGVVAAIRDAGAPAVFPERSANRRLVDAVARETGATVGDALYADTLGPAGSPGATYLGAQAHNSVAIARAVTGDGGGCTIDAAP